MDFIDEIKILGGRSKNLASNLLTEEATKTSLILPFIKTFTSVGTIGFYGACLEDEAARR